MSLMVSVRRVAAVVGCVLLLSAQALPASAAESSPTLSPTQGTPGTAVTASASDWPGCTSMSVSGWGSLLATTGITPSGVFALHFNVPANAPIGTTQLQFSPTCTHSTWMPFVPFTVVSGPPSPPSRGCVGGPSHILLGLHGMNEGPSSTKGADPKSAVETTGAEFKKKAEATAQPVGSYDFKDLPYPTYGISNALYDIFNPSRTTKITTDVATGVNVLEAAIHDYLVLCPSATFALVGYSEGAWVIDGWLHSHQSEAVSIVKAIELYGDPWWYRAYGHDSGGKVLEYQGLVRLGGGATEGPPWPIQNTKYDVQSLCYSNDPVCGEGFTESNVPYFGQVPLAQRNAALNCAVFDCPHKWYALYGATTQGGDFLASRAFAP